MQLIDLVPELLLHISSFIPQVDLLNVSLTSRKLRDVTEPELYREYATSCQYLHQKKKNVSLRSFVRCLVRRPELARHVRLIYLRTGAHLSDLSPKDGPPGDVRCLECTREEYEYFAQAAVTTKIITNALPYGDASKHGMNLWRRLDNHHDFQGYFNEEDIEYLVEAMLNIGDTPFDEQFCTLLRLGLDDPFVVLLMGLASNLRELNVRDTAYWSLPWRVDHPFRSLRKLTVVEAEETLKWPVDFFKTVMRGGNLECIYVGAAGSGRVEYYDEVALDPDPVAFSLDFQSLLTKITSLRLRQCSLTKNEMEGVL